MHDEKALIGLTLTAHLLMSLWFLGCFGTRIGIWPALRDGGPGKRLELYIIGKIQGTQWCRRYGERGGALSLITGANPYYVDHTFSFDRHVELNAQVCGTNRQAHLCRRRSHWAKSRVSCHIGDSGKVLLDQPWLCVCSSNP